MKDNNRTVDVLIIGLLAAALVACTAAWLGAWTAATVTGRSFNAPFIDGLAAAHSYLTQPSRPPTTAWNGQAQLPGPTLVYPLTVAWALAIGTGLIAAARAWSAPLSGYADRRRLGANPEARFARPRELATLYYRHPVPGRFVLGRTAKRTLASVNPRHRNHGLHRTDRLRRWLFARRRAEAFGAIAILGLSQTGKSQHALTALRMLSAAGCPMICSSVKGDIVEHLLAQRRRVGQVGVFDPTGKLQATYEQRRALGHTVPAGWDHRLCIGWSPLDGIDSYDDATAAAHRLAEAGPDMDKVSSGDFWKTQAEILITPLLWIAARAGRDMGEVTMWVIAEARPDPEDDTAPDPEPLQLLEPLLGSADPAVRGDAVKAEQVLYGVWNKAATTVGSVYATANTLLQPWATEQGRASSTGQLANLDWLLAGTGQNTLFISAPPQEQRQLRPVLTSAVSSVLDDIYRHVELHGPLDPPLVVFLDEAGNAPLARLPEYLSTLAAAGVLIVTVWQDVSQIRKAYGDHAGSILSNSRHVLIFGGSKDTATLDWVRQILGDEGATTLSTTNDSGTLLAGSVSASEQHVPLTPANVLREMPAHKALLISGNNLPAEVRHIPEHTVRAFAPLRAWPYPPDTTLGLPATTAPGTGTAGTPDRLDPARRLATTFDSLPAKAIAHLNLLHTLWTTTRRHRKGSSGSTEGQAPSRTPHQPRRFSAETISSHRDPATGRRQASAPTPDHELDAVTERERRTRLDHLDPTRHGHDLVVVDSAGVENLI